MTEDDGTLTMESVKPQELAKRAYGWVDRETVEAYVSFDRHHNRYLEANKALVSNALLEGVSSMLDVAAGLGGTTQASLPMLSKTARIICVEPSKPMCEQGKQQLQDPRVRWRESLPARSNAGSADRFERILCGAAIWQLTPLSEIIATLSALLKPGGALCFNMPALYLGQPDAPGAGDDPHLLDMMVLLSEQAKRLGLRSGRTHVGDFEPMTLELVDQLLLKNALSIKHWSLRYRLSQEAYRDWLKIPLISNGVLPGVDVSTRNRLIDEAFARLDPGSWRWETWQGWTAWRDN